MPVKKTVDLTLAFSPGKDLLKKITAFVREKVASGAVLKITVDPKILGGAIISFQGKYLDGSLKEAILKRR
ncbi:F0F1 ATP synthase subunit delta [Candidatus Shapirobacteria bacterium]|nr:F0F1 ATP synthase subunit delta [Candidatus Shapirobacteria bacterium]